MSPLFIEVTDESGEVMQNADCIVSLQEAEYFLSEVETVITVSPTQTGLTTPEVLSTTATFGFEEVQTRSDFSYSELSLMLA